MRKTVIQLALILFFYQGIYGNTNATIPSNTGRFAVTDTQKLIQFMDLALRLRDSNPDSSIFYCLWSEDYCKENHLMLQLARCYDILATDEAYKGNYERALVFNDSALKASTSNTTNELGMFRMTRGNIYQQLGKYEQSIEEYLGALNLLDERAAVTNPSMIYSNLCTLLNTIGKPEQALVYAKQELALAEKNKIADEIAWSCGNISYSYQLMGKMDNARIYTLKLYEIAKTAKDLNLKVSAFNNMGILSMYDKKYEAAAGYYQQAVQLNEKVNDDYMLCNSLNNMASAYQKLNRLDNAKECLEKALKLSLQIGANEPRRTTYELLGITDAERKDYKSAYNSVQSLIVLNDSLLNEKSQQAILNLEAKYQSQQKESQLKIREEEGRLQAVELDKQKILRDSLLVIFVLLIISGALAFNRFRRLQIHKREVERARISRDLHDDVGSTLGSISMYAEVAKKRKTGLSDDMLDKIGETSREMLDSMNDIVWAVNPKNDSFEQLVNRMRSFAAIMLSPCEVNFTFDIDEKLYSRKLQMEQRRNLFLIYKEAIHNIVKYAACKNVVVKLSCEGSKVKMKIADDGKGIISNDYKIMHNGNGLVNMKERAVELGGQFAVQSLNGNGTTVELNFKI